MMRASRSIGVAGSILAITLLGLGVAQAAPTAGSLLVPPESTGPQTFTHDGSTESKHHTFFQWPNYLTGIGAGPTWRLDVTGIDVSGLTGPNGRSVRFQLNNVIPIGGTIYDASPQEWRSLMFNVRLNVWGDAMEKDLFQLQESGPGGLWGNIRSAGFDAGDLTRDYFDLRLEFSKASTGDVWTVTPSYRLDGGAWTLFDGGTGVTTGSWDFASREDDGYLWPDYGGSMLDMNFEHWGAGAFSVENAQIYAVAVPAPAAIPLTLLGLGLVSQVRRRLRG